MRRTVLAVLVAGVALAACSRATPSAGTTTSAPDAPAPAAAAVPVGSTGHGDVKPAERVVSVREVTVPAGTRLPIVLDTPVGSDTSRAEEAVHAHLARALVVNGVTVLPAGSGVSGVVTDATRSGRVKGLAHIAMRFDTIVPRGEDERYRIRTAPVGRTAEATKKKDALEIGAPAAGGAIIGAIVGGKKGALVGGAVGGGAGTAVVLSTRGKEVHVPKGAALTLKLSEPLAVRVR